MSKQTVIIDGGSFIVRHFEHDDARALSQSANNRAIWLNLRDRFPHPYTEGDARKWIDFCQQYKPSANFAIAVDGSVAGGIGIMVQDDVHKHTAEIGYWLAEPHWGKGIMSKVVTEMTSWYFANFDLMRIYALAFDYNPASARVLQKAGYELEGRLKKSAIKDGRVLDQLVYARIT